MRSDCKESHSSRASALPAAREGVAGMKTSIFFILFLANLVALLCLINPWFEEWANAAIVFFILEAVFLLLIGVPVFVHHMRKGLSPRQALTASLDSVMGFMSGWI